MWTRRRTLAGLICVSANPLVGCGEQRAQANVSGLPSLIDTLPSRIQAEVRAGRYSGDLSAALREAIESGQNFVIPPGVFPFAGDMVELRTTGQHIVGTGGILQRLAKHDGLGLLVSADGVRLDGLRLNGEAPATLPSHHSDMVKVTGAGCAISDLTIVGSQGSNLRIDRAKQCTVIKARLTNAYQNNIIICNGGTQDVRIVDAYCDGTTTQNNIYVTASEGGVENGEHVSNIQIVNAQCLNSADTGIELGYHCFDSKVLGGRVVNSVSPGLLQRDGRRNLWKSVTVQNRPLRLQHANYDGVAVMPQWEPATWDSDSRFEAIVVQGHTTRSAFYWGQSGIQKLDCRADAFALGEQPRPADRERYGSGDMKAGDVSHIRISGGSIKGYIVGDNWNFDAKFYNRIGCSTKSVEISNCKTVFNLYNVATTACAIVDNDGEGNFGEEIILVKAMLVPDGAHPDIGLIYDGNKFGKTTGHPALKILLPEGVRSADAVLLSRNSRFVGVPADGMTRLAVGSAATDAYRLQAEGGAIDISVTAGRWMALAGSPSRLRASRGRLEVAVENGMLVLHQQGALGQSLWVKVSGPGIRPAQPA